MTSVLIIEERTGPRQRRVELRGAGLPFMGAEWAGAMTVSTQWNPGNAEGVQHVLGPQELPSSWEGEWNTTRLIATPCRYGENGGSLRDVAVADTLRDLLEVMFRAGQLLRVTWVGKDNRRITRLGRATEWRWRMTRPDDLRWSVTFDWLGRDDGAQKTASQFKGDELLTNARALIVAANDAAAAIEVAAIVAANQRKQAATTFSLGQLEQFANGPREIANSFARFANAVSNRARHLGDLIVKIRDTPAAILGTAVDVGTNALAVANQFIDQISREGPETMSTRNKVSSMLRASSYYGNGQTQAELMADIAQQLGLAARRRRVAMQQGSSTSGKLTAQDILTVHMPRSGETMLSISQLYYQADLSFELCKANGLPGHTITPPRTALVIPEKAVLAKLTTKTV